MRTFAAVLGGLEIVAALLIAAPPLFPRLSVIGSVMGVLLFLSTLSFLFATPGVTVAGGFPVLSVLPGQSASGPPQRPAVLHDTPRQPQPSRPAGITAGH